MPHVSNIGRGIDPSKLYVTRRQIGNLTELGKLSAADAALLQRADGIIAAKPKDGFIDASELLSSRFTRLLLPEEKARLGAVWKSLGWDAAEVSPVSAPPAIDYKVVNAPPLLDRNESLPIASLPSSLQGLARRIQLVRNADQKATTISPAEAVAFSKNAAEVSGLLPAEAAQLPELLKSVYTLHNQLRPYAPAERLNVTALGRVDVPLNSGAAVELRLVSQTTLRETRSPGGAKLTLSREYVNRVSIPAGANGLIINAKTGEEMRLGEGAQRFNLRPGHDYLFEVWKDGQRIQSSELRMPVVANASLDLSRYSKAQLTAVGLPLHRHFEQADGKSATWIYSTAATPTTTPPTDLAKYEPQQAGLAPGVYAVPLNGKNVSVEVRPGYVSLRDADGVERQLTLSAKREGWEAREGSTVIRLYGAHLAVGSVGRYSHTATIRPDMRVR